MKKLLTLFTLLLTVCSGAWADNGDVLFSQDFNSSTAVAYDAPSSGSKDRLYNSKSPLTNLVGTGDNLFTSIASHVKKGDIAINSTTGGNNVDATGIFQVYSNGDNENYWSLNRTSSFATIAPKALKVSMDIWFKNISSGSDTGVSFAVGDGFTDGLVSTSRQDASNVHSGFGIMDNGSATLTKYGDKSTVIASAITQSAWLSFVWIINNTGETLEYDNPTGSGTTELNNDCFDIWLKTQAGAVSTYTRVSHNIAATTAAKDLQNIYIGYNSSNKKKIEFRLDNVIVTDLTPSVAPAAPEFTSVTSDPSPANVGKNDEVTFTAVVTGTPTPTVNWYECNSEGGERSASKGTGLTYSPTTDALGTKYYIAVASNGVDPNAESDVLSVTVTGSNLCKLLEARYSNGFNSFINEANKTVTVYYMEGADVPTVTGTPVVSDGATYDISDASEIVVTAEDETTTATYSVTRTAVSPYNTPGELAFDGTETWIKTGNTFDNTKKWRFSKNDDNWQRETPGQNRIYFFVGPASSIELKTTANVDKGSPRNIHVYVNGVKNNVITSQADMGEYLTIPCNANTNNMVEILSNQTNGDGCISHINNHVVTPITIGSHGWTSFISDKNLNFEGIEGLTAYRAKLSGTTVTLNDVTEVDANKGIVLKGAASATYYVPVLASTDANIDTDLTGSATAAYDKVDGMHYYVLANKNGVEGFYEYTGTAAIPARKAFFETSSEIAGGKFSIVFADDETDGIKAVSTKVENGVRYNLAGQKVGADYKGIVIVNGKKVIIK